MDIKEFDDLINLGRVKRSVNLGSHEIVLCTLNSKEYASAMAHISPGASSFEGDKLELMQREIVVAAIRTIDGKELPYQDKAAIVYAGQLALSNLLYSEYVSMVEEQNKVLEDVKKNSSQNLIQ